MKQTQKTFSTRLFVSNEELDELWQIHRLFHSRLRYFLKILKKALDGQAGESQYEKDFYKMFVKFVLAAEVNNAKYLFNGVSKKSWVTNTANKLSVKVLDDNEDLIEIKGSDISTKALKLLEKEKYLFDKKRLFKGLPRWAAEFILTDSVTYLKSYRAAVESWKTGYDDWSRSRAEWEKQNQEYLKVRPVLVEFQRKYSLNFSNRRRRWDKYLEFLKSHQELAAWRGKKPIVNELLPEEVEEIKNTHFKRRFVKVAEYFFRANPELSALDRRHAEYEKLFAPKIRKDKLNNYVETEGYRRIPSFTLPDFIKHPRWLSLNGEQTNPSGYKNLELPVNNKETGSISLNLLNEEDKSEFRIFRFRGDQRFLNISRETVLSETTTTQENTPDSGINLEQKNTKGKKTYYYFDEYLNESFPAELKSARMRFLLDRKGKPRKVYLDFSVRRGCLEISQTAKEVSFVESGKKTTASGKPVKRINFAGDITAAFIHLGISNPAYAVLATGRQGEKPTILDTRNLWQSGPKITEILKLKKQLAYMSSIKGKSGFSSKSYQTLSRHIKNMEIDRYKKTARRILDYALNRDQRRFQPTALLLPKAEILFVSDFKETAISGDNSRLLNKYLKIWKRTVLISLLKDFSSEAGIRFFEFNSWGNSLTCSRCGNIGKRFMITKKNLKQMPDIKFIRNGRHFACSFCGYRENSEKNAAINLANSVYLSETWLNKVNEFFALSTRQKAEIHQDMETALLTGSNSLKNFISI